jgi:hypothetical protein
MNNKEPKYRELTLTDKKAIFSVFWMGCKHGKCEHDGQKSDLASDFQVTPQTISRVWESVLSSMRSHLSYNLMFPQSELFDKHMLLLREFPDHVFASLKKATVGTSRKKKQNRAVLVERALNVPVKERGTYQNLANELGISRNMVTSLVRRCLP